MGKFEVLETPKPHKFEIRLVDKDGAEVIMESRMVTFKVPQDLSLFEGKFIAMAKWETSPYTDSQVLTFRIGERNDSK